MSKGGKPFSPAREVPAVSGPRTEHTNLSCDAVAGPGSDRSAFIVGKGGDAGLLFYLPSELDFPLRVERGEEAEVDFADIVDAGGRTIAGGFIETKEDLDRLEFVVAAANAASDAGFVVPKFCDELVDGILECCAAEGISPETLIAEAVRAYLGIEDGVVA